jgi:hypothetical protein
VIRAEPADRGQPPLLIQRRSTAQGLCQRTTVGLCEIARRRTISSFASTVQLVNANRERCVQAPSSEGPHGSMTALVPRRAPGTRPRAERQSGHWSEFTFEVGDFYLWYRRHHLRCRGIRLALREGRARRNVRGSHAVQIWRVIRPVLPEPGFHGPARIRCHPVVFRCQAAAGCAVA